MTTQETENKAAMNLLDAISNADGDTIQLAFKKAQRVVLDEEIKELEMKIQKKKSVK